MITYFVIGVIVQIVILIERAIRLPEIYSGAEWDNWIFWLTLALGCMYNILAWPITIIAEIINVIYGI